MWARAVWVEGDREVELTVPDVWINKKQKFICWPPVANATKYLKERREPTEKWRKFPLLRVKMESDSYEMCDGCQITQTEESEDSDKELPKRQPVAKRYEDFVVDRTTSNAGKENMKNDCSENREKDEELQATSELPVPPPKVKAATCKKQPESQSISVSPQSSVSVSRSRSRSGGNNNSRSSLRPSRSRSRSRIIDPVVMLSARYNLSMSRSRSRSRSTDNVVLPSVRHRRSRSRSMSRRTENFVLPSTRHRRSRSRSRSRRSENFVLPSTRHRRSRSRSRSRRSNNVVLPSTRHRRSRSRSMSRRTENFVLPSTRHRRSRSRSRSRRSDNVVLPSTRHRRSRSRLRSRSTDNVVSPSVRHRRSRSRSRSRRLDYSMSSHSRCNSSRRPSFQFRSQSRSRSRSSSNFRRRSRSQSANQSRTEDRSPSVTRANNAASFPIPEGKFQKTILRLLVDIKQELMKGLNDILRLTSPEEDIDLVPAASYDELLVLEESLNDLNKKRQFVKKISLIGGVDLKDGVRNICRRLMTHELMSQLNMKGQRGKYSFGSLQICKLVKEKAAVIFKATEQEVAKVIGTTLKYAPDRPGGLRRGLDRP